MVTATSIEVLVDIVVDIVVAAHAVVLAVDTDVPPAPVACRPHRGGVVTQATRQCRAHVQRRVADDAALLDMDRTAAVARAWDAVAGPIGILKSLRLEQAMEKGEITFEQLLQGAQQMHRAFHPTESEHLCQPPGGESGRDSSREF